MNTDLVLLKGVGAFTLKDSIEKHLGKYEFDVSECVLETMDEVIFAQTYSMYDPEELSLNVEDGKLESIMCYSSLMYLGENLIGLTLSEFEELVQSDYIGEVDVLDFEEDNDVPQYVYEFERIGLQIWTRGDRGIILTIIVDCGV